MKKKSLFRGSGDIFLFRENSLMIAAAVVSLMLQIISFFTTLDGAKAYFEATFAFAPLLFALAVQSVVYFLENNISRRVTFGKAAALTMAIICSSYFSYVGIYNNINPPSQYLQTTYKGYAKQLTAQLDSMVNDNSTEYSDAVNTALNGIITEYTRLTAEKTSLETLAEQINSAKPDASTGITPPRRWDYAEYSDYAEAYSAYIAGYSQSANTEQAAQIKALLEKYGFESADEITPKIAEMTAQISLISGTVTSLSSSGDFFMGAEMLRAKALNSDADTAKRLAALYRQVSGKELVIPQKSTLKALDLPQYEEVSAGLPDAAVREKLMSIISAACDELNAAGIPANSESYGFENIYTLPIAALSQNGLADTDALVSLILALLVDLLSLIFAMIFVRNKPILAAKNTEQALNINSGLFEQNIMTALELGAYSDGGDISGGWSTAELTRRLADFICCFSAADFASKQGYSLIAPRDSLTDFEPLVAFLCQFGLAHVLTSEEAKLMTNGEINTSCVLLKTRFMLWFSERCDVKNRLYDAEEGGESL